MLGTIRSISDQSPCVLQCSIADVICSPSYISPLLHEESDNLGLPAFSGDMERRHSVTIGFVDDIRSHHTFKKSLAGIVSSIPYYNK